MNLRQKAELAAASLGQIFPDMSNPVAFIQTGSGFVTEGLLELEQGRVPLAALAGMPDVKSVAGHHLELVLGMCGKHQVLVAEGRHHVYEGLGVLPCVLPVCAAMMCGIRSVVLLAACGSVNSEMHPGDIVLLTDYINNIGVSPLAGTESLGASFFVEMSEPYSHQMISGFINVAAGVDESVRIRLGVYQANCGPQFETPAEAAAARRNGADVVGMSIVPETIAARALGGQVMGIGLVANMAACGGNGVSHAAVTEVAAMRSSVTMRFINQWILTTNLKFDQ